MSYKRLLLSSLLGAFVFLCNSINALAENSAFDEWSTQRKIEFEQHKTTKENAFSEFLRKEWKAFQVFKGEVRDATPKPAEPPRIRHAFQNEENGQSTPVKHIHKHTMPSHRTDGTFFGHKLKHLTLPKAQLFTPKPFSNEFIANTWGKLEKLDHTSALDQLQITRQRLDLGDWGTLRMIEYYLSKQFADPNQRTFYLWFLLTKMEFKTKLGYSQDQLVLLLPTKNKLFGIRYTDIDHTRYYMFPEPNHDQLISYEGGGKYTKNLSPFDFSLSKLIKPTGIIDQIEIEYRYQDEFNSLSLQYDIGFSELLTSHPQIDLPLYFQHRPSSPVYESFREQLQPHLTNRPPREALDYLLNLTQFLFQYKTDTEQFGHEKYLIIEESLYYGINDCEDRSIFLAWLIHDLLKLELVVLDYPGHVALAVKTHIQASDDLISYKGRKFVVVDPTYIGAKVGQAMPEVVNRKPKFIEVGYTPTSSHYSSL